MKTSQERLREVLTDLIYEDREMMSTSSGKTESLLDTYVALIHLEMTLGQIRARD